MGLCDFDPIFELLSISKTVSTASQVRKLQNQILHNNIGGGILPQAIHGGTRLNGVDETSQDTTIKYVPVQVRPAVAKLRERVAKVATEETGPQQVRAWKLFLFRGQDALPRPRTANEPTTQA